MVTAISGALHQNLLSQLQKTGNDEKKSYTQLSTGKKGNTDSLVKTGALDAAVRGLDIGSNNASSSGAALSIASGGLQQTLNSLQSLRELAVQAADDSLSSADRRNITTKAQDTLNSINDTARSTTYNGNALLDGSFTEKQVQVGPNAGDTTSYNISGARAEDLGVQTIDLSNSATSGEAITAIDSAIASVGSQLATLGSKQSSLETIVSNNNVTSENVRAAKSQLEDLDYAQAVGQIKAQQVKKQSQIQTLALLNTKDQNSLKLLA